MGIFHRRHRIGPVAVGMKRNRRTGRDGHVAACTKNNCGWSATFDTPEAADLAAQEHRCTAR